MAKDNLGVEIQASLDKNQSRNNIFNDIKSLEKTPFFIRLIAKLYKSLSKVNIENDIKALEKSAPSIRLNGRLNRATTRRNIRNDADSLGNIANVTLGAQIDRNELQQSVDTARDDIEQNLQNNPINVPININGNINNGTQQVQNLNNQMRNANGILGNYLTARDIFRAVTSAIKEAVDEVEKLNKAQTDLQIATSKSSSEMKSLMQDYNQLAIEMSSTTLDVTGAADDWLRQGQSVANTNTLVRDSLMLSKIGQLESAEATQYLTSAMKGYQLQANDVINVVDKLSATDMAAAVSAGGLAEAMSKCANSASTAGVSMDALIGYIATVAEVTQKSDSVVGESFKTIMARMGKIKLNDWIDDDGTDISGEINDVEKTLGKFNIALRESATEFRDFEDVIYDVGMAWDKFSSVDKNAIANAFGGVYQRENVLTLFNNFSRAMELAEVSANSTGTALEKFAIYENSLEAATNRLTASLEGLAYNTIDPNFLTGLANATAGIVEFVDSTQLIKTGLTAGLFTGAIAGLVAFGTRLVAVRNNVTQFTQAMNLSRSTTALTENQFTQLMGYVNGLSRAQLRCVVSSRQLNDEQRISILTAAGLTRAEAQAQLQTWNLTNATNAQTAATFSLRGGWEGLKASIATNPIGLIVTALTLATTAISTYNQKQEEARRLAVEMADNFDEQATSLQNLRQEYINIVDSESSVAKKTEELNKWKQTLIETYGFEKEAIEGVNFEREKGLELLDKEMMKNQITSAETWLTENNSQYENAKKKLTSRNNSTETSVIPKANVVDNVTKDTLKEYSSNFDDIIKQLVIKNPTKDNPLAQIKIKGKNTLEQYENLQKVLNDITSIKVTKGLNKAEEELYNSLLAKQKEYKKVVTDDIKDIYETGNKYSNMIKLFEFETDDGIGFNNITQDNYKTFRDKFLESLGYGLQKDSTDYALDIEQTLLDMLPEYEKVYRGIEDIATEGAGSVSNANEDIVDTNKDTAKSYDDLSKTISDYVKNQKTLSDALEEQNEHGQLSASTIQALTDAGYARALVIDSETGAVTLNKQAYEQLNKEKKQAIILEAKQHKSDLEQKYKDEQSAISDLTLEMKYANEERRKAIALELAQHGQNMAEYLDMIDKINSSTASLDAPTFEDGKKETPTEIQNFLDDYAKYHHDINMGIKKEDEDYYNWLEKAAEKAYSKFPDYEQDWWKYQEEAYKGRKELLKDYFDTQQDLMDENISSLEDKIDTLLNDNIDSEGNILNPKEKFSEVRSAYTEILTYINNLINEIVQSGVEGNEERLAKLEKKYDEYTKKIGDIFKKEVDSEVEYIESLQDAWDDVYDKRISVLEKEKSAIEERYDTEIKALENKNKEEKRTNDLIKARQDLEKANRNKRLVFDSMGNQKYVADTQAVSEAQQAVKEVETEIKVADLEKKRDSASKTIDDEIKIIKEQKEQQNKYYDTLLKILEAYLNPKSTQSIEEVWDKVLNDKNVNIKDESVKVNGTTIDTSNVAKGTLTTDKVQDGIGESKIAEKKMDEFIQESENALDYITENFLKTLYEKAGKSNDDMTKWDFKKIDFGTVLGNSLQPMGFVESSMQRQITNAQNFVNNNKSASINFGDINVTATDGNARTIAYEVANELIQECTRMLPNAVIQQIYRNR